MAADLSGMNTYVGMGGWDLYPFDGIFYPTKQGKGFRKLAFYSHFFDCVEVNATFYHSAFSTAQVTRWLHDVSENGRFLFTVKLFRGFTHTFSATKEDHRLMTLVLELLERGGRFGGLLMQFPVSFENSHEHRFHLVKLIQSFSGRKIFVEVRHRSWDIPSTTEFFKEQQAHWVNVDLPPLRHHIPFSARHWDGGAYFRMMGRNSEGWRAPWHLEEDRVHLVSSRYDYCYDETNLVRLANTVSGMSRGTRIFVIFHNDPHGNSLFNGFRLRNLLMPDHPLEIPKRLIRAFPSLAAQEV